MGIFKLHHALRLLQKGKASPPPIGFADIYPTPDEGVKVRFSSGVEKDLLGGDGATFPIYAERGVVVNSIGNDGTAVFGNINKPYKKLQTALTAAPANSTIHAFGTFDEINLQPSKLNVTLEIWGSVINANSGTSPIFKSSAPSDGFVIIVHGNIQNTVVGGRIADMGFVRSLTADNLIADDLDNDAVKGAISFIGNSEHFIIANTLTANNGVTFDDSLTTGGIAHINIGRIASPSTTRNSYIQRTGGEVHFAVDVWAGNRRGLTTSGALTKKMFGYINSMITTNTCIECAGTNAEIKLHFGELISTADGCVNTVAGNKLQITVGFGDASEFLVRDRGCPDSVIEFMRSQVIGTTVGTYVSDPAGTAPADGMTKLKVHNHEQTSSNRAIVETLNFNNFSRVRIGGRIKHRLNTPGVNQAILLQRLLHEVIVDPGTIIDTDAAFSIEAFVAATPAYVYSGVWSTKPVSANVLEKIDNVNVSTDVIT